MICFSSNAAFAEGGPLTLRVAAYNVEFSKSATPEQIGEMFEPFKLDIIGFNEAPDGDWTKRVGKVLGMDHSYVGKISSANHKDKYKTILSRTPIEKTEEIPLKGTGWNPASAVKAVIRKDGIPFTFYSLHICASKNDKGHAHYLASEVLTKEKSDRVIVAGDFNNRIGDQSLNFIEKTGMRPIWKDLKIDLSKQFTWNALAPEKKGRVIDHIFYKLSSSANATEGGIIELKKPLSDHKPVWAELTFPRTSERK
ncbi:endonuclease/exonuclease/phosphatase family protein [bacterium]|nr:endonuclease/exonuclease/phosphatase family protein [bacterium]